MILLTMFLSVLIIESILAYDIMESINNLKNEFKRLNFKSEHNYWHYISLLPEVITILVSSLLSLLIYFYFVMYTVETLEHAFY